MKALVLIDLQNDFITGSLGTPEAQAIIPKVLRHMGELNTTNTVILATKDTHEDDYLETQEGKNLPVVHCKNQTEGWHLQKDVSELMNTGIYAKFSSANVINSRVIKNTFGSELLVETLKTINLINPIDEIILMGLCTDVCVIANATLIKTAMPEIPLTVDASCCAGVTPESHKNALQTMKTLQINVINEGV